MYWNQLRPDDAHTAATGGAIAVLSLGSTEFNGWHLPLGLDSLIGEHFSTLLGSRDDCVVMPPLDYGVSGAFQGFPGTLWVTPSTLTNLLVDILSSARQCGFTRFLVLNNHGPNFPPLEDAVRQIHLHDEANIFSAWPLQVMHTLMVREGHSPDNLGHSKDPSTSLMMTLHPALVGDVPREPIENRSGAGPIEWRTSNAAHFRGHTVQWITDVAAATHSGSNVGSLESTAEMGEDLLAAAGQWLQALVEEVHRTPPPGDGSTRPQHFA